MSFARQIRLLQGGNIHCVGSRSPTLTSHRTRGPRTLQVDAQKARAALLQRLCARLHTHSTVRRCTRQSDQALRRHSRALPDQASRDLALVLASGARVACADGSDLDGDEKPDAAASAAHRAGMDDPCSALHSALVKSSDSHTERR